MILPNVPKILVQRTDRRHLLMIPHLTRPEAAFALRKRLNETVEELDQAKRDMSKLQVDYDRASRELTIAKSDCELFRFCFLLCAVPAHSLCRMLMTDSFRTDDPSAQ